jgi:hypothetical protein
VAKAGAAEKKKKVRLNAFKLADELMMCGLDSKEAQVRSFTLFTTACESFISNI